MDKVVLDGLLAELKIHHPLSAIDVIRTAKGIAREVSRHPERQKVLAIIALQKFLDVEFDSRIKEQLRVMMVHDLVRPIFDIVRVPRLGCLF